MLLFSKEAVDTFALYEDESLEAFVLMFLFYFVD